MSRCRYNRRLTRAQARIRRQVEALAAHDAAAARTPRLSRRAAAGQAWPWVCVGYLLAALGLLAVCVGCIFGSQVFSCIVIPPRPGASEIPDNATKGERGYPGVFPEPRAGFESPLWHRAHDAL